MSPDLRTAPWTNKLHSPRRPHRSEGSPVRGLPCLANPLYQRDPCERSPAGEPEVLAIPLPARGGALVRVSVMFHLHHEFHPSYPRQVVAIHFLWRHGLPIAAPHRAALARFRSPLPLRALRGLPGWPMTAQHRPSPLCRTAKSLQVGLAGQGALSRLWPLPGQVPATHLWKPGAKARLSSGGFWSSLATTGQKAFSAGST